MTDKNILVISLNNSGGYHTASAEYKTVEDAEREEYFCDCCGENDFTQVFRNRDGKLYFLQDYSDEPVTEDSTAGYDTEMWEAIHDEISRVGIENINIPNEENTTFLNTNK